MWLLYRFAGYEDEWQEKIEDLARANPKPFNHWFPEGDRVYLPFKRAEAEVDTLVENALAELGYDITDYRGGYAESGGRTMKIGKIIARAKRDVEKHYNSLKVSEPERAEQIEQEKQQQLKYWNDLNNIFLNSPHRQQKNVEEMYIVISQNPHDIAKMSYERSWSSCMELGEGSYHTSVFCEVESGGLVAYLVEGNDLEIKKPLSRIHIRRFDSADGKSIAKAEGSAYGEDIEGFEEAVDNWLDSMNENYPPGRYERSGGSYSDTYNSSLIITPDNEEELIKWFKKEVPDPIETTWTVTDNFFEELNDANYFEGGHIWPEGEEDGEKTFRSEEEAKAFLQMIQGVDYEEYWMESVFGDWEKEQYKNEIEEDIRVRITQEMLDELDEEEGEEIDEYDLDQRIHSEVEDKLDEYIDAKHDALRDERFELTRSDYDHSTKMAEEAAVKILGNPSGFSVEIFDEMEESLVKAYKDSWSSPIKKKFYEVFPERLTVENFLKMPISMKKTVLSTESPRMTDEKREELRQAQRALVINEMDPENKDFTYRPNTGFRQPTESDRRSYVSQQVTNSLSHAGALNHIDDELFDKIMSFFNNEIQKVQHLNEESISWIKMRVFQEIGRKLDPHKKKELVDTLMGSYDEKAWYRDPGVTLHNIGMQIASLGSLGAELVPFFRRQLETIDERIKIDPTDYRARLGFVNNDKLNQEKARQKRRILYILDSIESGAGKSNKYQWYVDGDY